jgi:4-amino-4-deoxy-L-arabinose transferase-like glycosyltransferase
VSETNAAGENPQPAQSTHLPIGFWVLLALTAAVRLVAITRPLLGVFATKNVVYAMIARNWVEGRASLWYPTLDCIRGGERSLHMLEFPVSAYVSGWLWGTFGGSLDVWGRATAIAFSVASVAMIFLFVRRRHGQTAALGAGFVLAVAPVSIIYGQSFMLEASLVFFTLATFDGLDRWLRGGRTAWLVLAAICFALLLLTKIYMLVLLLPIGVMILVSEKKHAPGQSPRVAARGFGSRGRLVLGGLAVALAMVPAAAWYTHAMRTAAPDSPLEARVHYSVRQSAEVHRPPHPLLWSPDFYRQGFDDLIGVVLAPVAFMLVVVGLLDRAWRQYAAWLVAMVVLVAALPLKFYEMNYYYMAVLPPLAIVAGLGWAVFHRHVRPSRAAVVGLVTLAVLVSLRYTGRPAWVTPEEDRAVPAAAWAVRDLTSPDEPVVTMHGTSIDLLYYCNRRGWAVAPDTAGLDEVLAEYRRQGARFLVVAGPGVKTLKTGRPPVVEGDGFRVYRL